MHTLSKFSFGVGDRFAHQAKAQLKAFIMAAEQGADVVPVWNKSHREHTTVGSQPDSVRAAADVAVRELGWKKPYHVDADHIRLETVGGFIASSDFYTIDVADSIGKPAAASDVTALADKLPQLVGRLQIPGIEHPFTITRADVERIAAKYLLAVQEAGRIYRHIADKKGANNFITEVSMDETDAPQTPPELLVILAAIAAEKIPIQTIAPKFTGRFNKGVDYVGDLVQFEKEFNEDLAVIAYAVKQLRLARKSKIKRPFRQRQVFDLCPDPSASLSPATEPACTSKQPAPPGWKKSSALSPKRVGEGLTLAKEIYAKALKKKDALCAPYAAVIDIDVSKLPSAETVAGWTAEQYVNALRHDQSCPEFNSSLRQLIHVGYKIAAEFGDRYLHMLEACEPTIAKNVTGNLFDRHMKPLLL